MPVAVGRVSQTEVKPSAGFRAELQGLDLATLVQLTCSRRERMVARITSYGEEGFLYSVAGRIVHATLGEVIGEEAVVRMLGWSSGDFVLCELPFPARATIQRSTEGLLLLAAKRADDSALDEVLAATGESSHAPVSARVPRPPASVVPAEPDARASASWPPVASPPPAITAPPRSVTRESVTPELGRKSTPGRAPASEGAHGTEAGAQTSGLVPVPARVQPLSFATPLPPAPAFAVPAPKVTQTITYSAPIAPLPPAMVPPGPLVGASTQPEPRPRATLLPPAERRSAPPPAARRSSSPPAPHDPSVLASVRVDARGALVSSHGAGDHLAQLTAYVARLLSLLQLDFALDPFEALHAELHELRVLVFQEAGEVVGVMMRPGSTAQDLRARLGV